MLPELIYCAGKNQAFETIAHNAGFRLGAQLPCTVYYPVYFADQNWKNPRRPAYMAALNLHRPHMATVLDYERHEQYDEIMGWAEEAAQYVNRVLIIPKAHGCIARLPRRIGGADVVLGYSVPTKHGGTAVWPGEFAGWPVHLLGGSPHAQMRLHARMSRIADIVSVDGNMHNRMAHMCRFWNATKGSNGHWHQLNDQENGNNANARAFAHSCRNIVQAWQSLYTHAAFAPA